MLHRLCQVHQYRQVFFDRDDRSPPRVRSANGNQTRFLPQQNLYFSPLCLVQLSFRTIRLIEQRLRVGHQPFCNGAHVQIPPCGCTERLTIRGKAKARPLRQDLGGPRSAALFYRGDDVK